MRSERGRSRAAHVFLAPIDQPARDALALLLLRLHGQGLEVATVFRGLWLFPLGLLVLRCGFIPKALGALAMIGGSGLPRGAYLLLAVGGSFIRLMHGVVVSMLATGK